MKTWIRIIFFNIIFVTLILICAEVVFGDWINHSREPKLWKISVYRSVSWQMSTEGKYFSPTPAQYSRDRYGLRGEYGGDPARIQALVLGGSTTDERFVSNGETWTDTLAACLTKEDTPLAIANGGVAGQSTRGHLRNFDVWYNNIPGLRPRLILAYVGINERHLNERQTEDDVLKYNESSLPLWAERLKVKSALYSLYTTIRGNIAAWRAHIHHVNQNTGQWGSELVNEDWAKNSGQSLEMNSDTYRNRLATELKKSHAELEAYAERLRQLTTTITGLNAKPVYITQSAGSYRIANGVVSGNLDEHFMYQAINATTLKVCAETGTTCLDLGSNLSFGDDDFYDHVHTTPQGSGKVGRWICAALRSARLP